MEQRRASDAQLRVADAITAFAGSMPFVYLHAVMFALWMLFVETTPWPTLTLVVSLEAIFLSTFVMICQNRQSAFQPAKGDHDFVAQELELKTNTDLTRQNPRADQRAAPACAGQRPGRGLSPPGPCALPRPQPVGYNSGHDRVRPEDPGLSAR